MTSSGLLNFQRLASVHLACLHLQSSPSLISEILQKPESFYEQRTVKRRKGSARPRTVYKVKPGLRRIHRTIALALKPDLRVLDQHVQGFVPDRSIWSHAARHKSQEVVVTADISDFFGSISFEDVLRVFDERCPDRHAALLLSRLCTLDSMLPQGARSSPALANLASRDLDRALTSLATRSNARYSRYADDLAFSGDSPPDKASLRSALQAEGFDLRPGSYRWQHKRSGQQITGLSLVDGRPRLPRAKRRTIEHVLHHVSNGSLAEHVKAVDDPRLDEDKLKKRIEGWSGGYRKHEPELAAACDKVLSGIG